MASTVTASEAIVVACLSSHHIAEHIVDKTGTKKCACGRKFENGRAHRQHEAQQVVKHLRMAGL